MNAIEIIKAKQAEQAANDLSEKLQREAKQERLGKAFAPIMEAWKQVEPFCKLNVFGGSEIAKISFYGENNFRWFIQAVELGERVIYQAGSGFTITHSVDSLQEALDVFLTAISKHVDFTKPVTQK